MVSYAIVYRHGLEAYVQQAKAAGVSRAIVPICPWKKPARWPTSAGAKTSV